MRTTLLFFGIFLSMIFYSHAQPANDDCANAESITVSFLSATDVSYDPSLASQSTQSSCDNVGITYNDVWYSFTMPNAGNIQITSASNSERFTLYDACGGTEIACFNGNDYFLGLSATSYILRVAKQSTIASADTFTINIHEKPANDECANAEVITADISSQQSFNYDNRGATQSLMASCDSSFNTYLDVWYQFTMPFNGNLHITGVNIFDRFTVYDSCGGAEIACDFDDTFAYNLTPGTYFIRVNKQLIYASADSFNIQAFPAVANDECADAIVITDDISTQRTITYDNRGATESLDASCDNFPSNSYLDIWYEFTMPVNGNLFITGVNIFDRFTLYDTCGGMEIACDRDDTFVYNLTTGTYVLRVSKEDIYASVDSFNIQAFPSVANDECVNAEIITDDITTETLITYDNRGATESLDASCDSATTTYLDIWYEFTMPVEGNLRISGVNIFDEFTLYDSCGGSEISCATNGGFVYDLAMGTYLLRVYKQDIYASVDSFRIQAIPGAANDECVNAEVITEDITTLRSINFDNRSASESTQGSCDFPGNTYLDVWYEFTMPVTGNLEISGVNGSDRFTIYDGCGGSEIACFNDDDFVYGLTMGTYILRAYSTTIQASEDGFNIQAFAAATNDECITAEVITDDISTERTINFDSRSATESLDASCDVATNTNLDLWYEFTMPFQGNVQISGVNFLSKFSIYDSCGGMEIDCFNGQKLITDVSAGNYFLRVNRESFSASDSNFRIQAFAALPNDDCANAQTISISTFEKCFEEFTNVEIRGALETPLSALGSCFNTSQTWLDVWYTFQAPITGNINITASGSATRITVYDSCGGAEVVCIGNIGVIPVVSGNTYYLQIARNTANLGATSFCMEIEPSVAQGSAGICESIPDVEISTMQGNLSEWVPILDTSGRVVAAIRANGEDLGTVSTTLFIENTDTRDFSGQPYLRREVSISTTNAPSSNVSIRLFVLADEVDDLILADSNLSSISDLEVMKVNGNTCTTGYTSGGDFINTSGSAYSNDYYIGFSSDSFSVFYPTSTNLASTLSIPTIETNELGITVVPTITDGIVHLSAAFTRSDVLVNVFDITGRNIYQRNFERISTTNEQIDLSDYQSGVYFMKITHQNTQVTKRIIVQ
ncbi:MAG: T9SS type A sorting domain-containing protein [Bacteroidota bacterium]